MAASTKRRPTKAAVAVKRTPSASATALRQKALELAVTTSAMDYHYNGGGTWPSSGGGSSRRYASETEILKTAKAFLTFMSGE